MGRETYPAGDEEVVVPPQPTASRELAVEAQAQEESRNSCQSPNDSEQIWPDVVRSRQCLGGGPPAVSGRAYVQMRHGWLQLRIASAEQDLCAREKKKS